MREAKKLAITWELQQGVEQIEQVENQFRIHTKTRTFYADKVIITTGGQPKRTGFDWISALGIPIVDPVPSLFSFNIEDKALHQLMGNVIEQASAKIAGQKLKGIGPILITHWGLSGPAILQLSAWGARILEEKEYTFTLLVNWLGEKKEEEVQQLIKQTIRREEQKQIQNYCPLGFTTRFWVYLLTKLDIPLSLRWKELQGKYFNKLVNGLINDVFQVKGKTTFKEEFVTAGGIDLKDIDVLTMQSKTVKGIYFAGEVIDIDGITGGFNFQSAWTTGYIAGKLL